MSNKVTQIFALPILIIGLILLISRCIWWFVKKFIEVTSIDKPKTKKPNIKPNNMKPALKFINIKPLIIILIATIIAKICVEVIRLNLML